MSSAPIAQRRRQLDDAQWLEAMGIDPFWIESAADARFASPSAGQTRAAPAPVATASQCPVPSNRSWSDLEAAIRECRACGLCQGRQQAVPGTGDLQATWLMVGEAPGAEEDATGLPFVGKAGKLLDAMLAALGLNRESGVYIANAVKCRPPQNRTPETGEIQACNHFLDRQIDLIQPQIIVALGKPAAQALLGHEASIQSLRGTVHGRVQGERRIPVVVTYHPAYLLRQPEEKWKAWQDLLLAQSTLNTL